MGEDYKIFAYIVRGKIMFIQYSVAIGMMIPFFIIEYFVIKWAVKNGIKQYYAEKEQFEKLTRQLDEHHKKKI